MIPRLSWTSTSQFYLPLYRDAREALLPDPPQIPQEHCLPDGPHIRGGRCALDPPHIPSWVVRAAVALAMVVSVAVVTVHCHFPPRIIQYWEYEDIQYWEYGIIQ